MRELVQTKYLGYATNHDKSHPKHNISGGYRFEAQICRHASHDELYVFEYRDAYIPQLYAFNGLEYTFVLF
jgi:hypothetical protein